MYWRISICIGSVEREIYVLTYILGLSVLGHMCRGATTYMSWRYVLADIVRQYIPGYTICIGERAPIRAPIQGGVLAVCIGAHGGLPMSYS